MICQNCQSELSEKATKRKKYCSDSCRVSAYIKRSGYKPLGNIKNVNLWQIEAKDNQFKPNNELSFVRDVATTTIGVGIANIFSTEKLSKVDYEISEKELKNILVKINNNILAMAKQLGLKIILNPDIQR